MIPPAPAKSSATVSGNQKGMRRTPRVHVWVSRPLFAASEGENVVEDIFKGAKRREDAKAWYDMPESLEMMCAPTMYICYGSKRSEYTHA